MQTNTLLTNKKPLLDSLGTSYNMAYYSQMNSENMLVEQTFNWSQRFSLPGASFGDSSSILIPINQFLGEMFLYVRLPNLVANQQLCPGWLFAAIESINYQLGASGTTAVTLSGDSIWQCVAAEIDNEPRRSEVFRLAGLGLLTPNTSPSPGFQDIPKVEAMIPIPTCFSTMCERIALDTTLMTNNIQVTVAFKTSDAIYSNIGVRPTEFLTAQIVLRQGKLSDQAMSLRSEMIANPDLQYSMPFTLFQSFSSPVFQGVRESQGIRGCQVTLSGLNNADLTSIVFYVVAVNSKMPENATTPKNPFHVDPISNVLVQYNGNTLFEFPGTSYKLAGMLTGKQGAVYYKNQVLIQNGPAFEARPVDDYLIFLDFAALRSACIHNVLYNTAR